MWPLLGVIASQFPIDAQDAKFNSWVLAWGADRLVHGLSGFWSPPIFYPYPNVLAYSENLLGIAVLVAPFHWASGNPVLTYNIALLLSFVVAGVSAYALARELTGSRAAALVAALGFAFAPYRWAQLTHLQVLWTAWLPLVFWALHRALRAPQTSHWAVFIVVLLLQLFSNGYSGFQVAIAIAVIAVTGLLIREVDRRTMLRLSIALAVAGLMVVPAALAHLNVWGTQDPTPGDLVANGADLSTYLSVHPDLPASGWLPGLSQDEGNLFPGAVIVLLAFFALLPSGRSESSRRWRWAYAAIALIAMILSLGPEPRAWGRPLPFASIYKGLVSTVPLFDALRVPARFGALVLVAVNVLAAYGVARLVSTIGGGLRLTAYGLQVALTAVACILIVFEGHGGPLRVVPRWVAVEPEAQATRWLAGQPPGAVLNLPMNTLGETADMQQQFAVLAHRHPTINGVSRLVTPLVELLSGSGSPLVVPELLPDAVPFLRGLGVRYVLMRSDEFFDQAIATRLRETLASTPAAHERGRFGNIIAWEIDTLDLRREESGALTRIAPGGLTLAASENPDRLSFAIDGNPGTRWLTGRPQSGSEWLSVGLDRPRQLARLEFVVHPRSLINVPRLIEVVSIGRVEGGKETILFRGSMLPELGDGWRVSPDFPTASIALPAQLLTSRIVLRQRGQASPWFWAIDELVLWARN